KALADALPENEKNQRKIQELEKIRKDLEGALAKSVREAEIRVKKLEDKLVRDDILGFDQPKGKILTLDRDGKTAYLNIGSADYVKPGLTFSIFGVGQYKANAERKASVEVLSVTGEHMCMARVTEIKSATRDPILTGDLLYNPAWTPGLREHVAIAGLI